MSLGPDGLHLLAGDQPGPDDLGIIIYSRLLGQQVDECASDMLDAANELPCGCLPGRPHRCVAFRQANAAQERRTAA